MHELRVNTYSLYTMCSRAFVFGRTPCEVNVRPVARTPEGRDAWVATVAPQGERSRRTHFRAATCREALGFAALHLEQRFGPLREGPPPHQPRAGAGMLKQ